MEKKALAITPHLLLKEAERRGWKTKIISCEKHLIALFPDPNDDPKKIILCLSSCSELGSAHGQMIAKDKMLNYSLASYFDIPVPESLLYTPDVPGFDQALLDLLRKHRHLVVKPTDRSCGEGVSTNITDETSLQTAIDLAKKYSRNILIQSYVSGDDYRVLVLNGRVIAAARRQAAFVVGDGASTIRQLIELKNAHPWRGDQGDKPLRRIDVNEVETYLGAERLQMVPDQGRHITLLGVASIDRGGEPHDVTETMHESIIQLAEKIGQIVQLGLCGVDLIISGDITQPLGSGCRAVMIETNSAPHLRMHHFPSSPNSSRNVSACILDEIIRRRQANGGAGIYRWEPVDPTKTNVERSFAPILSNPEEFLELSQGEKDYYAEQSDGTS